MLFVFVFVVAVLLVPVLMDVERHGADNIIVRSGRDILHLKLMLALRRLLHSGASVVGSAITMSVAALLVTALGYAFLKVLLYVLSFVFSR